MIEVNNLTNFTVDKSLFLGVAKKVLKEENRGRENLSIAFVSEAEIKELNKKYRKKDKATDVLAFELKEGFEGEVAQVVICPAVVSEKAKEYGRSFEKEMVNVLIHGILHVLGYDHELSKEEEERMFKKQEDYLLKLEIRN